VSSLAVLLANPAAGAFKEQNIQQVEDLLKKKGLEVEVLLSKKRGEIETLAKGSLELSPEMVFVIGGDGTFNEAVNGLVHSEVPVSFIPSGTANVVAKELDIPGKINWAVKNALGGEMHRISLGKVTNNSGLLRYFIMMAGAGFDADTVYGISSKVKKISGKGSFIVSGAKVLHKYDPEPITVRTNGAESVGYTVIVGNGSCYAGKFKMTPDASLFSPYFYVYVIKKNTRFSVVKTIVKLFNTSHTRSKDVSYFRTQSLSLEGSSHIQVDGDYLGKLPVDIEIERECLNILC
jgi:YegS/Rv2252/BmrU family lipid kinase